jgi:hypothetical protein
VNPSAAVSLRMASSAAGARLNPFSFIACLKSLSPQSAPRTRSHRDLLCVLGGLCGERLLGCRHARWV